MAVTVTNVTLVRDVVDTLVPDAATADVADTAEVFTITPAKGMDKMMIQISVANTHGAVAASLGAGSFWARKAQAWSCVQNVISVFAVVDIARFKTAAGTILLTLTPASGKKLLSEHVATVQVIELP